MVGKQITIAIRKKDNYFPFRINTKSLAKLARLSFLRVAKENEVEHFLMIIEKIIKAS